HGRTPVLSPSLSRTDESLNAKDRHSPFIESTRNGTDELRPRTRRTRTQPQEYRRQPAARFSGGVYRGVGVRQVVIGLRNNLCRGATAVSRIGLALCSAAIPPDVGARGRRHRGPAA